MIRSMTGYGEAERETSAGRLRLEVKTVNHRFFNSSVRTPPGYDRYENGIVEGLRAHVSRGHVKASLSVETNSGDRPASVHVDLERARAHRDVLESLQSELAIPGAVDLDMLARIGDIFRAPEPDAAEVDPEVLAALVDEAGRAVVSLREDEGQRLMADMEERLEVMAARIEEVEARAPERLAAERDRLREAVKELTEQAEVDEDRLAREIAYLADKWDIGEEVVRFRSHVELFREALEADGEEPVGKRLGFLVQELHREANTIGSKANDAEISHAAVAMKEEIERLREQVENVE